MIADEIDVAREGRPPHEPTAETRAKAETLSGYGLRREEIAAFIGIGKTTLEKYYGRELELGRVKADSKVAESLFKKATSDDHPQATTAAIWWEKTRAGRKEPKQDIGLSGAIGTFDASKLTDDELAVLEPILARLAGVGVAGGDGTDSEASG